MASVVVVRNEVVKTGREWRGWVRVRLDRLPVCSEGDPASCWLDFLAWPATRTSESYGERESPTLKAIRRRRSQVWWVVGSKPSCLCSSAVVLPVSLGYRTRQWEISSVRETSRGAVFPSVCQLSKHDLVPYTWNVIKHRANVWVFDVAFSHLSQSYA